jgi:hypothetical protein
MKKGIRIAAIWIGQLIFVSSAGASSPSCPYISSGTVTNNKGALTSKSQGPNSKGNSSGSADRTPSQKQ